ncbi:hypothetical protein [Streptomyces cyanogenus]|uniref:Uncharacterized protein n=1 Tax=Streptomyces cyanogenus TaxID=80860 RepID=A0ABX7TKS6_STRCY|nr:hypothetical protein [Streptomyces cyanogenus]QTD96987.1 hypothetical protein S1361_06460 [Streptomyces cyanogenus]
MPIPVWWPRIVAAADRRRHVTGMLLAHATPTLDDGVLRLHFADPRVAAAWQESGAQAALEGAMKAGGIDMPVETTANQKFNRRTQ